MRRVEIRLSAGLQALNLAPTLAAPLSTYLDELERWNAAYNLTAVRDRDEMVTRHLLDSLVVLPHVSGRVLDVGSGAGLPGIPLALANPQLQVTMLDSNGKKARFMRQAKRVLKLTNVEVVQSRVENYQPAQPFDQVISRAFASLSDFFAACARLVSLEGTLLAMKGRLDPAEMAEIPAEVRLIETKKLRVPGLDEERHLVIAGLKL
ncbi:MAG: 16S rRNA (guanine(527)-N(7))-methyltransferase RsmG [Pseudomonadota bacterium]